MNYSLRVVSANCEALSSDVTAKPRPAASTRGRDSRAHMATGGPSSSIQFGLTGSTLRSGRWDRRRQVAAEEDNSQSSESRSATPDAFVQADGDDGNTITIKVGKKTTKLSLDTNISDLGGLLQSPPPLNVGT